MVRLASSSAAETIGRRVVTGEFPPGFVLPTLEVLAKQFSLSRLTMRDAIKTLGSKGLLSSVRRRGTVVRPRSEWNCLDADVMSWQVSDVPNAVFARDLLELRRIVEPEAAALAAERASGEALANIELAFARMVNSESRQVESMKADIAFHYSILNGTRNEVLAAFAPAIETSLLLTLSTQRELWPNRDHFITTHQAVVDAIRRGDPAAARAATRALLDQAELDANDAFRRIGADISGPGA
jgi:DNA-binding FadR family transcriptional regulator